MRACESRYGKILRSLIYLFDSLFALIATADKYRNNAFLQTLKAQRARPPSQQTSLRGWQPATGPGKPGYDTGIKKNWNDAPKVHYIEGRGRVVAWG